MAEIILFCLQEIVCASQHYSHWSPKQFKQSWKEQIEAKPEINKWEFKYCSCAECFSSCNQALEDLKRIHTGFSWTMTLDGELLVVRAKRINITT